MGLQEVWREAFAPDSGALLDIRVYGTSDVDYRTLLSFLQSNFRTTYMRDGVEAEVPSYNAILSDNEKVSAFVRIDVGVQINLWFHSTEEVNMDLLPDEVDSVGKAEDILDFMQKVATLLNKRVLLTAENASADEVWAERHSIFSVRPTDGLVTYHPELDNWSRY